MNFNYDWMKHSDEEKQKKKANAKKLGEFESGEFKLSDAEISYISSHFANLNANRIDFVSRRKNAHYMEKTMGEH